MIGIRGRLSSDLLPVYDHEVARGNAVVRVDEPGGTASPLVIVFNEPLDLGWIPLDLPASVRRFESRDPHYEQEQGYYSTVTRHAVVGPPPR